VFTVKSAVRLAVTPYFRSMPALASYWFPSGVSTTRSLVNPVIP
jgi:hypothetical protein